MTYKPYLLCLIFTILPCLGLAQDESAAEVPIEAPTKENVDVVAETVKSYFLFSGQTKVIKIDSEDPSSLDEEVVSLKKVAGTRNQYRITGVRNGTTQIIYFTSEGIMDHIRISVDVPSVFSARFLSPRIVGSKPVFSYLFSQSSAFNDTDFFISPSHSHSGTANLPRFLGGGLSANAQVDDEENLVAGNLNYKTARFSQIFGNFSKDVSSAPTLISGSELMGSAAEINWGQKSDNRIEAFVGELEKENYSQFEKSIDQFGGNYSFAKFRNDYSQPDFFRLTGFGYRPDTNETHKPSVGLDSIYNFSRIASVESNFLKASGGFASQVGQHFNTDNTSTNLSYAFVKGGLEGFNNAIEEYDKHAMEFDLQHLFKDQATFFTAGAFYNKSNATNSSLNLPDFYNAGLATSIAKQYAERHSLALDYSLATFNSDTNSALTNGLAFNMVHIVDLVSYMSHRVSANYTTSLDSSEKNLQYGATHAYSREKEKFLARSELNWSAYALNDSYQSFAFSQRMAFNLKKRFLLDFNLNYSRPILSTNTNSINLLQTLSASLTHNDFLSLGLGGGYAFGNNEAFNGSVGLQFQKYFGPGIEKDSILKRLVKGSPKSNIYGQVYLDLNYNSYFDSADQPLSNITVTLDKQTQVTTNEQGVFVYPKVKAGQHQLTLAIDPSSFGNEIDSVPDRNLTTEGGKDLHLNLPVAFKKSELQILFAEDVNEDNMYNPFGDKIIGLKHAYITGPDQKTKSYKVSSQQGGIQAKGLDAGKYRIAYDPLETPEEFEPTSSIELVVDLAEKENKTVVFLFRAIRVIYGKLEFDNGSQHLANTLKLMFNDVAAPLKNDHFTISNPPKGRVEFTIPDLPAGFCIQPPLPYVIMIDEGALQRSVDFNVKAQCD